MIEVTAEITTPIRDPFGLHAQVQRALSIHDKEYKPMTARQEDERVEAIVSKYLLEDASSRKLRPATLVIEDIRDVLDDSYTKDWGLYYDTIY